MTKFFVSALFWLALLVILCFLIGISIIPPIKPFIIYVLLFGFSCLPAILIAILFQQIVLGGIINFYKEGKESSFSKVLATGITITIFISAINEVIKTVISFLFRLVVGVPNTLISVWGENINFCSQYTSERDYSGYINFGRFDFGKYLTQDISTFFSSECFSQVFSSVFRVWSITLNEAVSASQMMYLPFGRIVLGIAIWTFLIKFIDRIESTNENHSETNKFSFKVDWLRKFYTEPLRSNILFFTLLAVGTYLCIASIAAIPSLQNPLSTPVAVNSETLEEQIDGYVLNFHQRFPIENNEFQKLKEANPFSTLDSVIAVSNSASEATTTKTTSVSTQQIEQNIIAESNLDSVRRLKQVISVQQDRRRTLIEAGEEMIRNFNSDIDNQAKTVKTQYEVAIAARKGERETVEHFLLLTQWFAAYSNSRERQINSCLDSIEVFDSTLGRWSNSAATELQASSESRLFNYSHDSLFFDSDWVRVNENCNSTIVVDVGVVPARPELGGYLGPFQFVASWLLRTESLPLALITGLIGFGLLGSACSSFVREHVGTSSPSAGEPLVKDLPKVVVIGLSAAILAFLSVMGGLAVFFSTGSNPNPYALLLGCLIAAAFGEDVWQWARGKLRDNLKPSDEDRPDKSDIPQSRDKSREEQ